MPKKIMKLITITIALVLLSAGVQAGAAKKVKVKREAPAQPAAAPAPAAPPAASPESLLAAVLAGIYTLAFLTVMLLFCTGNILLKMKRRELPTETRAAWGTVLVAGLMITLGLLGNVLSRDSESLSLFLIFGVLFLLPVQFMLHRISIIRVLAVLTQDRFPSLHSRLVNKADDLANKPLIFISDDVRDFSCILLFAFLTHFFSLAG